MEGNVGEPFTLTSRLLLWVREERRGMAVGGEQIIYMGKPIPVSGDHATQGDREWTHNEEVLGSVDPKTLFIG